MHAASVRVSALDEVGNRDAPVGYRPWALWVVGQAKLQREELERDASALRRLIGKMQKHQAWKALGVPSFDMLCTTQLRLSADEVSAVLKARKGQSLGVVLASEASPDAEGEADSHRVKMTSSRSSQILIPRRRLRRATDADFDESVRAAPPGRHSPPASSGAERPRQTPQPGRSNEATPHIHG